MEFSNEEKSFSIISAGLRKNVTVRTFIGFAISGVLLWFTFYSSGLKWQSIVLKDEQYVYFTGAILSFAFAIWIQAMRAKLIWGSEKIAFKKMQTYPALLIGNFYNCILPGNLGEGMRAFYFSKKHKVSFTLSLSVAFTEKWIDAQIFICLAVVLLLSKPFVSHYILYAIINTTFVILLLSITYFFVKKYRRVEKTLWLIVLSFKKIGRFFFRMYWYMSYQIKNVMRQGSVWYFVLLSIATLFLNVLQFWLLFKAAGVSEPVGGLYSAYLIAVSMMIISFIPSAPSNIGVLHYGIYSALILAATQYHITPDSNALQSYALFAVYLHLSFVIPELSLGLVYVVKERKILFG